MHACHHSKAPSEGRSRPRPHLNSSNRFTSGTPPDTYQHVLIMDVLPVGLSEVHSYNEPSPRRPLICLKQCVRGSHKFKMGSARGLSSTSQTYLTSSAFNRNTQYQTNHMPFFAALWPTSCSYAMSNLSARPEGFFQLDLVIHPLRGLAIAAQLS
jgi:hypothetical protein